MAPCMLPQLPGAQAADREERGASPLTIREGEAMKAGRYGRWVMHRLLPSLLCVAACVAVSGRPAVAGEGAQTGSGTGAPQPAEKAAVPEGAAGMTIYIDPTTGAILKEPAPGAVPVQLTPELRNALSTSQQGLVEVPGTTPGGGVKVDLQRRFQSPLVVTIDANGKVKMQHVGEPPGVGEKK